MPTNEERLHVAPIAWVLDADTLDAVVDDVPVLSGPAVDLEVLVTPYIRARPEEDEAQLRERIVQRGGKLLQPLRGSAPTPTPRILLTIGDPTVEAAPDGLDAGPLWATALEGLLDGPDRRMMVAPATPACPLLPSFTHDGRDGTPLVTAFGIGAPDGAKTPYAYMIVIALGADGDVDAAQAFVRGFAERCSSTAPLYVIGVSTDGARDSACWERLRASIVLGPRSGVQDDIATISRTPVDARRRTADVSFVPCPTFRAGVGEPGATRVRVDAVKGQAQIAFSYDRGHDLTQRPVQVVRALHSASRISVGERRLHGHVIGLLEDEAERLEELGESTEAVAALRATVEEEWKHSGYVTVCTENGRLAGLRAVKAMSYLLLLVIRPREGGGYELLLSNHSPLQESRLGEWSTLLLPAFQFPATLLGHLRDDVLRQATERAEDLERGEHAIAFEAALTRILRSKDLEEDVWVDQVREIAGFTTRKISPTSGVVTEYDYHFVTLLPLVERVSDTGDDEAARDPKRLITWFRDLDSVRDDFSSVDSVRGLAMASLQAGGAAVRFEPSAELLPDPNRQQRAQAEKAPPGAVWFPLGAPDEPSPWRDVPAIVARNADVMAQLDRVLRPYLKAGALPDELLLSGADPGPRGYVVDRTFAWDEPTDNPDKDVPGLCTTDALAKVKFADTSDLKGQLTYPERNFRRVYLVRRDVGLDRADREAILVVSAETFERVGAEDLTEDHALGRLRPVQRYVLEKGLERVQDLKPVFDQLAAEGNQWGFARVRKDGVGIAVSVTPPIVEQLHEYDRGEPSQRGDEERDVREFIVCDGTHRVVERAWRQREPLPAILVDSQPLEPYYARPFGALEWEMTAEEPLATTPSQSAKYTTRRVTEKIAGDNWSKVQEMPESSRFRRYYRNLEAGFGRLGGQGGRFA